MADAEAAVMRRFARFLKISGVVVAGILVLVLAGAALLFRDWKRQLSAVAGPFQPECSGDEPACGAWVLFRTRHPYPYQAITNLGGGQHEIFLLISEPPPGYARNDLEQLIRSAFGSNIVKLSWRRWALGDDGWLEDVIITVRKPDLPTSDPLSDPALRDGIALLHYALFGTTYGASFEAWAAPGRAAMPEAAPDLELSPRELTGWVKSARWSKPGVAQSAAWDELAADNDGDDLYSADGTLALYRLPRADPAAGFTLGKRASFRRFAVATDVVLGGIWSKGGFAAVVARTRHTPVEILPPLRFETAALLAAQTVDALAQSYERNALFAGKLDDGNFLGKDWAPVFLSPQLVDTELGALLDVTDQLLKSWSEAGTVEYVHFNYPKPAAFPFEGKPLSKIAGELLHSQSVLFNWNTSGAAAVFEAGDLGALTVRKTGSLPVTYGAAKGADHGMDMQGLFKYEESAYDYFSSRKDPNLERVVQYTTLYQVFRQLRRNGPTPKADSPSAARSSAVLAGRTASLLTALRQDRYPSQAAAYHRDIEPVLADVRRGLPELDEAGFTRLLADRQSSEMAVLLERVKRNVELRGSSAATLREKAAHLLDAAEKRQLTAQQFRDQAAALEGDKRALSAMTASIDKIVETMTTLQTLQSRLADVAADTENLEKVRVDYEAEHRTPTAGSIKTPSIVLSWSRTETLTSTGGSNVDARPVRFEASAKVRSIEAAETPSGTVVRYNPELAAEVGGHAAVIARAVDHEHATAAGLQEIVARPVQIRPPRVALQIPEIGVVEEPVALIGERLSKAPSAEKLREITEKANCCIFVARGEAESVMVAHPPPPSTMAYEIRDTPTLIEHLRNAGTKRSIVFLDAEEGNVEALSQAIGDGGGGGPAGPGRPASAAPGDPEPAGRGFFKKVMAFAEALRGERTGRKVDALLDEDLAGRRATLELDLEHTDPAGRKLFKRLGEPKPGEEWRSATSRELSKDEVAGLLKRTSWDLARDGTPSAIEISFGEPGEVSGVHTVGILAGDLTGDSKNLLIAHERVLPAAAKAEASVSSYLLHLKNDLRALSPAQYKRLVLVVEDEETRIVLSKLVQRRPGGPPPADAGMIRSGKS